MAGSSDAPQGWQGPRRPWLVAVLFGLIGAVVVAGTVAVVSGGSTPSSGGEGASGDGAARVPAVPSGAEGSWVLLIGDSITERSESVLAEGLGGTWEVVIDGRPGYTVGQQLPAAERLAEQRPRQVVVNLGTNDVLGRLDLATSLEEVRAMVDFFPSAACIHLVTVNRAMWVNGVDRGAGAVAFDDGLQEIAAADPRITVVDWDAALGAAEAAGTPRSELVPDTVHPSPAGQELLVELYRDALAGCG